MFSPLAYSYGVDDEYDTRKKTIDIIIRYGQSFFFSSTITTTNENATEKSRLSSFESLTFFSLVQNIQTKFLGSSSRYSNGK